MANIKIDELISRFKEFKEELNKNINASYSGAPNAVAPGATTAKAEATKDAKVMPANKIIKPSNVKDVGAANFTLALPKGIAGKSHPRHPMSSKEVLKTDKNGQWSLDKAKSGINVEDVSLRNKEADMKVMPMVGKAEGDKAVKIHSHGFGRKGDADSSSQFSDNKGKGASGII